MPINSAERVPAGGNAAEACTTPLVSPRMPAAAGGCVGNSATPDLRTPDPAAASPPALRPPPG